MASQAYKILIKAKDQASGTFKKLGSVAKGTAGVVGGVAKAALGASVALAAVATTVAVVAKKSFDFADAIGKVATRTGMATDTVQAFQIAAIESGSTMEVANKSLEKFTRSVGDAQRGLKTQADIFKDLGVSITDVNGNTKDMDTLLREVSDGMAGLKSQSEKATVAANLFGRAGIQIIDVLDNGGAAFDAYIDKAKQYGLILSEDGIRQSEAFNDTLAFLNRQFKTATTSIAIAFLPILQNLASSFKEVTASTVVGQDGVMKWGESIRDVVLNSIDGFIRGLADMLDGVHDFRLDIADLGRDITVSFLEAEKAILEAKGALLFTEAAIYLNNSAIELLELKIRTANMQYDAFVEANESGGNAVRKFADNLKEYFINVLGMSTEEVENLLASYDGLINGFSDTSITDIGKPLDKFRDSLKETQIELAKDNAIVKSFKDAEDALVDFVKTGELSFKKMIDSFITELIRLQIRMSIIKPFFEAFESAGGFGKGGVWAGFGALFGGGKADGGAVSRNTPYLVGEKGAELFIPNTSGQIITNQNTEAMMGKQQPLNVNFSIQATDASGFDQLLTARKNQIISMVSQAMNQKGKAGLI
jgi:hypothetical protein